MEVDQGSGECQDKRDRSDKNPEGNPRRNHWEGLRTRSKYNVTEAGFSFIILKKICSRILHEFCSHPHGISL